MMADNLREVIERAQQPPEEEQNDISEVDGAVMPPQFLRAADPLVVIPYDAGWPLLFRQEAGILRQALGDVAVRIDRIGSTAVPGLAAKPITRATPRQKSL